MSVDHHPRAKIRRIRSRRSQREPVLRRSRGTPRHLLAFAALEEIHHGNDSVTSLYASLLVRALIELDPRLADVYPISLAEISVE